MANSKRKVTSDTLSNYAYVFAGYLHAGICLTKLSSADYFQNLLFQKNFHTIIVSKSLDLDILNNPGVTNSVPTAILGNPGVIHSVPTAPRRDQFRTHCSGYGMDHAWVTEDEILIRSGIFRPCLGPNCLHRVSAEDNGRQRGNNNHAPGDSMCGSRGWGKQGGPNLPWKITKL